MHVNRFANTVPFNDLFVIITSFRRWNTFLIGRMSFEQPNINTIDDLTRIRRTYI